MIKAGRVDSMNNDRIASEFAVVADTVARFGGIERRTAGDRDRGDQILSADGRRAKGREGDGIGPNEARRQLIRGWNPPQLIFIVCDRPLPEAAVGWVGGRRAVISILAHN